MCFESLVLPLVICFHPSASSGSPRTDHSFVLAKRINSMSSSDAVQQIIEAEQDLSKGKPGARIRLMSAAQSLAASLETPSETIQRVGWAEV